MDGLTNILKAGITFPHNLVLPAASVDPATGKISVGIGYQPSENTEVGVWFKTIPNNSKIGSGIVDLINGIRAETSATDDSPGILTAQEIIGIVADEIMGKSSQTPPSSSS